MKAHSTNDNISESSHYKTVSELLKKANEAKDIQNSLKYALDAEKLARKCTQKEKQEASEFLIRIYKELENAKKVMEIYDKIFEYKSEEASKDTIIFLAEAASYFLQYQSPQGSLKYYERIIQIAEEIKNQSFKARGYEHLGYNYLHLYDYEKAEENFIVASKVYTQEKDWHSLANIENNLGYMNLEQGDFIQALRHLRNSLHYYSESGIEKDKLKVYINLGNVFMRWNHPEKALTYYLKAWQNSDKDLAPRVQGDLLNNIGNVHFTLKNYKEALEYHKKALEIRQRQNIKRGIAHSYNNIGLVLNEQQNSKEALDYLEKALKLKIEIGDKYGQASSLCSIGSILTNEGRNDEAQKKLTDALEICEQSNDKPCLITALIALGKLKMNSGNYASADEDLKKSLQIAINTGEKDKLAKIYDNLTELNALRKDFQEAYKWQKKYITEKENLFNDENSRKIAEMQAIFEVSQKEREKELLSEKNEELAEAMHELEKLKNDLEVRVDEGIEELRKKDLIITTQAQQAVMGEMIRYIAHQWKQPLNAINVIVQDIEDAHQYDELTDEYLEKTTKQVMQQVEYMSDTINDFRDFCQPQVESREFKLSDVIKKAGGFVYNSLRNNNIIHNIHIEDDVLIKGRSNELTQVLLNLYNNARAIFLERNLEIETRQITTRVKLIENKVNIFVNDNAGGINPEIMDKIFEPYFTTRKENNGTGLGLYMACRIVEEHFDGTIRVNNSKEGAEFNVEIGIPIRVSE